MMDISPLASPDSWFHWLLTYADLLFGLVFLIVVSLLLPGRVRWMVLTFGLGILALQFWQRRNARAEFARLDQQRSELRERLAELDGEVESLRLENQRLESRRQELQLEQQAVEEEAAALAAEDASLSDAREALARRRAALQQENMEAVAQQQRVSSALERWQSWRDRQEQLTSRAPSSSAAGSQEVITP